MGPSSTRLRGLALAGLLPLLGGCGMDAVGTWQLTRASVGGVSVEDVGFVDLRGDGDVSSGVPHALLFRYWWAPDAGAWEPDPTPFVQTARFDLFDFQDDPGTVPLRLDLPTGPDSGVEAEFFPEMPENNGWLLTDETFPLGVLELELER